ncbi:bifunctional folylpolyglutamate synthase/dihydrofolate synthase [Thermoleophilum album]|uniref:tetrahydrofolate synthase n=1 Tax=Thermoleophilum album TaxID=29539 RepID=A0A1H6FUT5_THEAL|nr:cyanophycin synthetase [Thermoleophilum album]SEH13918.1 dihydrofolate synthase / folylpolyglutamate synthase [Thermoleophilum album]
MAMAGAPTYREAERWLLGRELFGMRFGLDRMRKLLTALGSPQRTFRTIHVVGTNGKSSTTRFAAALLAGEGLRVGAYTSPHLVTYRERVEIGGVPISEVAFARAVAEVRRATTLVERRLEPGDLITQFEALTAAAFLAFAEAGCEVAVVEAGLGGRFDATNVIDSEVQVLTSVGLEHTRWLGPTVRDIAGEKLDVVTPGGTLVAGPLPTEALEVAERVCAQRATRLQRVARPLPLELAAKGAFQRLNFALALAACQAFLGRELRPAAIRRAAATTMPGRLEEIAETPLTLVDAAHNPDGVAALASSLPAVLGGRRPLVAVVAILEDKDAAEMLRKLGGVCDEFVFTRADNPRSLPPGTLDALAAKVAPSRPRSIAPAADAALRLARARAGEQGAVLATGSIYLVADLLRPAEAGRSIL